MKTEALDILNRLSEILGTSGEYIISEYVYWYMASSLSFIALGVSIIWVIIKTELPEHWDVHPLIVKGVLLLIGGVLIACNLADLLAPEAVSIHRLLLDVRGS